MKNKLYLAVVALLVLLLAAPFAMAQDITGLWEFTEVKVGDKLMTPVAKWTRINKDQTFQNGNGWQQNGIGTWTYDRKSGAYIPRQTHGTELEDEFGAFTVSFAGEKMIWEREEEGMKVIVTLRKITEIPMSPADHFTGLWDLSRVTREGEELTAAYDPDQKYYMFIRSDRVFVERTPENERLYGLWHINGHKPEITLIRNKDNKKEESWRIAIEGATLTMVGISDSNKNVELVFNRLNKFPE